MLKSDIEDLCKNIKVTYKDGEWKVNYRSLKSQLKKFEYQKMNEKLIRFNFENSLGMTKHQSMLVYRCLTT